MIFQCSRPVWFPGFFVAVLACLTPWLPAQNENTLYYRTTPLPIGRQMHGAAVIGDFLYVIGGALDNVAGYTETVQVGRILDTGEISGWADTTPLPKPRVYIGNCTFSRGSILYVCGGNIITTDKTVNIAAPDVLMARANPNGSLGAWVASAPFPGPPVQSCAAVHTATHVYVLGGADTSNVPQNVVYRAAFLPDGSLGPWAMDRPLPQPMWFHCAGRIGSRIFFWGGTTQTSGSPRLADVFGADVLPDGSLGPWTPYPPLPKALSLGLGVTLDPFLIHFAGENDLKEPNTDIFFAAGAPTGQLAWAQVLADLPIARYTAAGYDPCRSVIFLPGGRTGAVGKIIPDVFGFRVLGSGAGAGSDATAASVPPAPPAVATAAPSGPPPQVQWLSINEGVRQAQATGKPLLILLGSPRVPLSATVWTEVCQRPEFGSVAARHVCSLVDVTQDRSTAMALAVFRIPAIVVLSPRGEVLARLMGRISLEQVMALP